MSRHLDIDPETKRAKPPAFGKLTSQVSKEGTSVMAQVRVASAHPMGSPVWPGPTVVFELFQLASGPQESQSQGRLRCVEDVRKELTELLGTLVAWRTVPND